MTYFQDEVPYYSVSTFNKKFPSGNSLSLLHINCRSIRNKQDEVNTLLQMLSVKFDLILLTETWLTVNDLPHLLPGYQFEHLFRENKRGGGVAV